MDHIDMGQFIKDHGVLIATILGWGVLIWLQKKQLENTARLEVFKEISLLQKNLTNRAVAFMQTFHFIESRAFNRIQSALRDPFEEVAKEIPTITKFITKARSNKKLEAMDIWSKYKAELSDLYLEFIKAKDDYFWTMGRWHPLFSKKLEKPYGVLVKELEEAINSADELKENFWQMYVDKFDEWDRKEIIKKADDLWFEWLNLQTYFSDFEQMLNKDLLKGIFKWRLFERTPLLVENSHPSMRTAKVLTLGGLKEKFCEDEEAYRKAGYPIPKKIKAINKKRKKWWRI